MQKMRVLQALTVAS